MGGEYKPIWDSNFSLIRQIAGLNYKLEDQLCVLYINTEENPALFIVVFSLESMFMFYLIILIYANKIYICPAF